MLIKVERQEIGQYFFQFLFFILLFDIKYV